MNTQLALLDQDDLQGDNWSEAGQFEGFGALDTAAGVLPLKAMDVQGKIVGLLAHIAVEQTFVNVFERPLEATYIFPLPPQAAVTSFRMEVAARVVRGVLQERGQARQVYAEAIAAGQRAAIAEEERADVFSMQVGNLLPQEQATLRLTMTFPLSCRDGEVTFRFPLVVAPRYIPGQGLDELPVGDGVACDTDAVPDASRISPPVLLQGYPNPIQLALSLEIDAGEIPLSSLRSSLHTLLVGTAKRRYIVSLQPGERLNRDFLLRYDYGGDEIQPSLQLAPDHTCRPHWEQREAGDFDATSLPKDMGTFALTLTPPRLSHSARRPRDIVFVLDRSGSMSGWKMVVARRAVAQMIDTLHYRDQFQILAFDHDIEVPSLGQHDDDLVRARRHARLEADTYLSTLDARGGTEMAEPLQRAATMLNAGAAGRDRVMVLVTDGQVGNEDQILQSLRKDCTHLRIFTLGVDTAVNAGFLERLALQGGGACELVESEDRLEEAFARIQRLIETPVLSHLQIELEGLSLVPQSLTPGRLPDLFAGVPLCILGRYQGAHEGAVTLSATDAMGNRWRHQIFGQSTSNPSVPTIWARQQIRKLEDEIASGSRALSLVEPEILATSLQFGVLSRFTAFVAVDEEKVVKANTPTHLVVQAVEAPVGWTLEAEVEEDCVEYEEYNGVLGGYDDDAPDVSGGMRADEQEKVKEFSVTRPVSSLRDEEVMLSVKRAKRNKSDMLVVREPKPEAKPMAKSANKAMLSKPKPTPRKAEAASNAPIFGGEVASREAKADAPTTTLYSSFLEDSVVSDRMDVGSSSGALYRVAGSVLPSAPALSTMVASSSIAPGGGGAAGSGDSSYQRGGRANQGRARSAPAPKPQEADQKLRSIQYSPPQEPEFHRNPSPSRGGTGRIQQTQAGVLKGSFLHLSPEQVKSEAMTYLTDQFALGTLLYELLTGERLFARESELQTLLAIISEPLPSPLLNDPALQAFEPLLQRLLQRDPAARFANMYQAYDALLKVLDADALQDRQALGDWLQQECPGKHQEMLAHLRAAEAVAEVPEDGFLLLELLSDDDVSETWLAVRQSGYQEHRRVYAIRVAHPYLVEDADWLQTFVTEGQFYHEHSLELQSIGVTEDGEYHQVYLFVSGIDLEELLRHLRSVGRVMPLALVSLVIENVAACILKFHSRQEQDTEHLGFPHGSLSPGCVRLGFDGGVYVHQFGPMPASYQAPIRRYPLYALLTSKGEESEKIEPQQPTSPGLISRLRSFFQR